MQEKALMEQSIHMEAGFMYPTHLLWCIKGDSLSEKQDVGILWVF